MKQIAAIALAGLLTVPAAAAETPLTAAQFEAYVTGKTLYFSAGGVSYGIEEYRDGRQVRWSFLDGECKSGRWYGSGSSICFEYEDGSGPQCWHFFRSDTGLRAEFDADPPGTELYETRASDEPLVCLGPKVGV